MNESCYTWLSHIPRTNESCHTWIDWFWDPIFRTIVSSWRCCKHLWELAPHRGKSAILVQSALLWISQPDFQNQFINSGPKILRSCFIHCFDPLPGELKPKLQRFGTVSWVLRDSSDAHHPLISVIKVGIYHPRKEQSTVEVPTGNPRCVSFCRLPNIMSRSGLFFKQVTCMFSPQSVTVPTSDSHAVALDLLLLIDVAFITS